MTNELKDPSNNVDSQGYFPNWQAKHMSISSCQRWGFDKDQGHQSWSTSANKWLHDDIANWRRWSIGMRTVKEGLTDVDNGADEGDVELDVLAPGQILN